MLRAPILVIALALALDCGGTVVFTEDDDGNAGDDDDDHDDDDDDDGDDDGDDDDDDVDCEGMCSDPAESGCFEEGCVGYCEEHAPLWPPGAADAFGACVSTDPLCFATIEGCILSELFPEGSTQTIRLRGSGFSPLEGSVIHAFIDPAAGVGAPQAITIAGGSFELAWQEPFPIFDAMAPLVMLYVDIDGDGACIPGVDPTAAQSPEWNGDYVAPVFEVAVAYPLTGDEFVCDSAP